jgi:hypothetical protein
MKHTRCAVTEVAHLGRRNTRGLATMGPRHAVRDACVRDRGTRRLARTAATLASRSLGTRIAACPTIFRVAQYAGAAAAETSITTAGHNGPARMARGSRLRSRRIRVALRSSRDTARADAVGADAHRSVRSAVAGLVGRTGRLQRFSAKNALSSGRRLQAAIVSNRHTYRGYVRRLARAIARGLSQLTARDTKAIRPEPGSWLAGEAVPRCAARGSVGNTALHAAGSRELRWFIARTGQSLGLACELGPNGVGGTAPPV